MKVYDLEMNENGLSLSTQTDEPIIKNKAHLRWIIQDLLEIALEQETEDEEEQETLIKQWMSNLYNAGMEMDIRPKISEIMDELESNQIISLLSAGTEFPLELEQSEEEVKELTPSWYGITQGLTQTEADWM